MATSDDVEAKQRERENYLIAFYDLTRDEGLHWSTHRAVADKASIAEDRIMAVSHDLSGNGLVVLRTMGGVDGYVELTPSGVKEAERLIIARGSVPEEPARAAESTPESDRLWAESYLPMLKLAFEAFAKEGSWPDIDNLQRRLDQARHEIDVTEAVRQLPRLPGELRVAVPSNVSIPLRLLRYLPEAAGVLAICLELIRRAVDLYYSDVAELRLTSDDPGIAVFGTSEMTQVAARLLISDFPSPIAGGGFGPEGQWNLGISGASARLFRGVGSMDDYFARQYEIRLESQKQLTTFTEVTHVGTSWSVPEGTLAGEPIYVPSIFVVMPFEESWSTGVYDFIRRAVRSLHYSDKGVIRSDKITQPGKIDQQILKAIVSAHIVVGDITDSNPNVMWELGYAEAAKVPSVILNQRIDESPFDLANTRQVPYRLAPTDDDEENLAKHIQSALEERWAVSDAER